MITKIVKSNHYHIWTDALHARQLSKQTNNKWDRGTYVRWTILTAWVALEIACQDALGNLKISYHFRKEIDDTLSSKNLPALDWGKGIWQKVYDIQKLRNNIAHRFQSENDLFLDSSVADYTINTIRKAIQAIYSHSGKATPKWINDNFDEGWTTGTIQGHGTCISSPYYKNKDAIKISYLYKGHEYDYDYLAPKQA